MKTTGKKYKTTLAMVKDLSDPEFARDFERQLKMNTVYVYTNNDDGDVEVFSSLKLAKKFAEERMGGKVEWESNSRRGTWGYEYAHIVRKKIIRA